MSNSPRNNASPINDLTIVGIGASAGGLAALKTFFAHVPEDSGLAFVVVVHLSPDQESHLSNVLQPHVRMPVQQVTETVALEANRVYVIPPGCNLDTIDTHLRLSDLELQRKDRAPIDHFFHTLARVHDGHSVGIILSGTGSDGTLGIKEVKEQGGLTVVQEPREAEYDGMPQSALSTGLIDLVLPLAEIPDHIIRFAHTQPQVVIPGEENKMGEDERQLLQTIFAQIRSQTGRNFVHYKGSTVMRRLRRRMQLAQLEDLADYARLLRQDADEVVALSNDFLINVTNFFRDGEVFEKLSRQVIPQLFKGKGPEQSIRVWSVGCSTGEEAYSLMMLLLEEARRHETPPELQLFASDLHEASLRKAREGYYPGDIASYVSAERLQRFFVKEDSGYHIRKEVRDRVLFAPHNLLGDPPFSQLDLIVCRNVLIYLQREVQGDIMDLFHYALRPDGFLVLGTSETIENPALFHAIDKKHCLFSKRNGPAPELNLPVFPVTQARSPRPETKGQPEGKSLTYGALHQQIVERYAPPSLLVNPDHKVVHLSEHVHRYLAPSGGQVTSHIFKLVRPEFHLELRIALHEAQQQEKRVRSKFVAVQLEGADRWVILTVYPSDEPQQEGFLVVLFDEWESLPPSVRTAGDHGSPSGDDPSVQKELIHSQQRLQAVIEEHEKNQEEMKASSEEMQSTNEELRSTMEELETSKEELQSTNEELSTLNQENRNKVEELSQLSGDLQNLLASTDVATLFLDREFRIMRFTPQASELFNVRHQDRGRPLSDITHRLGYGDLHEDVRKVFNKLALVEREVSDDAGRWYLTRILPYRSAHDHIEGVVITFTDITSRKQSEENLRRSEEHLRLIIESATDYAIFTLDMDRKITGWNVGAERLLGYTKEEIIGQSDVQLFVPEDQDTEPEAEMNRALQQESTRHERWHLRRDGGRFWGSGTLMPLLDRDGTRRGFLKIMFDNTEIEQMKVTERAAQAKQDFLAHMSHEIRTPLHAVLGLTTLLLNQNPSPQQLENLQTLKFSAENLKMLVDDILDFSKIQAGKVLVEQADMHLPELLNSLQQAHQPQAVAHQIALHFAVDEQVPDIVRTDSLKLSQIMNNLIGNAVKFTKEGSVTVTVSLQQRKGDRIWVTFSVRDTGIGIPADKLSTIFDTFTQADVSTVREYGGTGLGLSITKLLLELLGSQIEVESELGHGARFFFTLPMRIGSGRALPTQDPVLSDEDKAQLAALQVLLVEDVAVNRMVLNQFLNEWWHLVPDMAEDGQQALEMAQQKQYDLILMDIRMPIMNGYQAAQAIRELPDGRYAHVPILALSADTLSEVRKHPEADLFADVVTKPTNPADLQQKIMRHTLRASPTKNDHSDKNTAKHNGQQGRRSSHTGPPVITLDLQPLEKLFHGDAHQVRKFLQIAVQDLTSLRQTFVEAVTERDEATLDRVAHKATVLINTLVLPDIKNILAHARSLIQQQATEEALQEVRQQGEDRLKQIVALLRQQLASP